MISLQSAIAYENSTTYGAQNGEDGKKVGIIIKIRFRSQHMHVHDYSASLHSLIRITSCKIARTEGYYCILYWKTCAQQNLIRSVHACRGLKRLIETVFLLAQSKYLTLYDLNANSGFITVFFKAVWKLKRRVKYGILRITGGWTRRASASASASASAWAPAEIPLTTYSA